MGLGTDSVPSHLTPQKTRSMTSLNVRREDQSESAAVPFFCSGIRFLARLNRYLINWLIGTNAQGERASYTKHAE
eukprot:scaffold3584_cov128-Cylindrotheca_fusiformis.AAC.2